MQVCDICLYVHVYQDYVSNYGKYYLCTIAHKELEATLESESVLHHYIIISKKK